MLSEISELTLYGGGPYEVVVVLKGDIDHQIRITRVADNTSKVIRTGAMQYRNKLQQALYNMSRRSIDKQLKQQFDSLTC